MLFLGMLVGACVMGLVWMLCGGGWAAKTVVKAMIRNMNTAEKKEILEYVQGMTTVATVDLIEDDGESSHWSTVSSPVGASCSPGMPRISSCQHVHTTRKGSNGFQTRERCKDCGMTLFFQRTTAGKRAVSSKGL